MSEGMEKVDDRPVNRGTMPMGNMKLDPGVGSASGRYWCVMCKKFFELDDPVCPYMTKMCVNTPLAVESLPPGSTVAFERVGLYHPKLVQKLQAAAVRKVEDTAALGLRLADEYLQELADWRVRYADNPLEAIKSFVIYYAGADVATRNTAGPIIFYVMDAAPIWGAETADKKRLKSILLPAVRALADRMGLQRELDLHFMDTQGNQPLGRFYCEPCNMFFEFGRQQDAVTCPFMPQKCKFHPRKLKEEAAMDLELLLKVFQVSPKLYRRFLGATLQAAPSHDRGELKERLRMEVESWQLEAEPTKLRALENALGL